ncbi:MCE family protein [Aeromicrobium terrae]|uniref:MCE family protein n=1 Tax=Aeromicrobium terrae TaxID=2498846 RepID=A0A5C8NGE2_9ACTN|nr:MCE family protein [Aeromicrobium terrae]TXL58031.1 MCE family protein [Aeromicrobium terrae]
MRIRHSTRLSALMVTLASGLVLSGCGFSPYNVPLPGGADVGDHPYTVKVEFRDVLDLVPQSAVRVDDIAVGKITDVKRKGWNAEVTLEINGKVELPDNAQATIRQTSLLGEKFVSLAPPANGGTGRLSNGDVIPLDRSGANPDIEQVFGAASLLFNGGGLDKVNTIVRELNASLDGNEPEVKQLLQSTSTFLGQLDDNKQALLTSLEKVNRLAITTNQQKAAITHALDDLPEALRVVNGQRDDLVGLLQSLDKLGDVATGVIRRSKADTLADLKNLAPVLRELANAGDNLAKVSEIILSFPFSDAIVGDSLSRALVSCGDGTKKTPADKIASTVHNGACYGDYANLDINLNLNTDQVKSLIAMIVSLVKAGAPTLPAPKTAQPKSPTDATKGLTGLVDGLGKASSPKSSKDPKAAPVFCSLLGLCRTPATSIAKADRLDVGRLLVGPAVAR